MCFMRTIGFKKNLGGNGHKLGITKTARWILKPYGRKLRFPHTITEMYIGTCTLTKAVVPFIKNATDSCIIIKMLYVEQYAIALS